MRGEGKARSRYPAKSGSRDNTSPEKKKPRAPYDDTKPTCNGCRRWITDRHTQDTCDYIKKKLPGYNKDWKEIQFKDSDAHKALSDKILKNNPDKEGPFCLPPPTKPRDPKESHDTKGMVCCNNLSYPNSETLPLIQGTLDTMPKAKEEEEEAVEEIPEVPTMDQLIRKKDKDNDITIFIDTGSGDNFISTQYAKSLINYGYKPLNTLTICEVCSPFSETCVPCGHTFSLNLTIKDGNRNNIKLNVVAKSLPVKYD